MPHDPSPAAAIAAALSALFVRLRGPGTPGKRTDAATAQHGDLLDLIRHRSRAPTVVEPVGNDFNDNLVDLRAAALRARLVPLFRCAARGEERGGRASRPEERRETVSAVINLRQEPKLRDAFEHAHVVGNTVLIDRRTKWGNPFRIGPGQDAAQAVARYRVHLWQRIRAGEIGLEDLAELESCWLACWCVGGDKPCHAEVLARAAAWVSKVLAERDAPQAHGGPS